ncbi:MAG: hypothetical protein ACC628_26640 [Pirellulaceae bacterium]
MGRLPRENITPKTLENVVWVGTNLSSYSQAVAALRELVEVDLSTKSVQRMTSQVGADRCRERALHVESFRAKPLAERTAANPLAEVPALGVVMMDGGRHQRRDHFGTPRTSDRKGHWKEDKVGLALSMESEVFEEDPTPDFPEWLAGAKVVSEIAQLAERDEQTAKNSEKKRATGSCSDAECDVENHDERTWAQAPKLLAREMIASTEESESFGWHLEQTAWRQGVTAAPRQAFVADGASVNWTIHRKHFSQMTGVLDLMHALSYAYRAAAVLDDAQAYRRFAEWIWQGDVRRVIHELKIHQKRLGLPKKNAGESDPRQRIHRALTYYTNHQGRMNYPEYRRQGLPLTSSHIESAIKQINLRVKGTEKFWRKDHAEALLQLRADSLSDSQPLKTFWIRWRANITGANRYRTTAV